MSTATATPATATAVETSFIDVLIEQIGDLGGDRRLAREVNGFIRYQLAGLSRGLIDCEVTLRKFGTSEADQFVAEIVKTLNEVAKKTDKDAAALLRRFVKIFENDYACVRTAALRKAAVRA